MDLNLEHLGDMRPSTLLFHVTKRLLYTKWRDPGEEPKLHLFGQLKRITKQWLDTCLVCKGGTYPAPAHVSGAGRHGLQPHHRRHHPGVRGRAPDQGAARSLQPDRLHGARPLQHLQAPIAGKPAARRRRTTSTGSFSTATGKPSSAAWPSRIRRSSPTSRTTTSASKSRTATARRSRKYLPDFIVLVDDGHGPDDLLHLVVEIKGYRREDAKEKKSTMETYWVPGVNHLGTYGRWAFAEFTEVYQIESDFEAKVESEFNKMIDHRDRAADDGRQVIMAKKPTTAKTVETLTHDEAKRKNIPTAEYQSVLEAGAGAAPRTLKYPAQHRPRSAARLARQG